MTFLLILILWGVAVYAGWRLLRRMWLKPRPPYPPRQRVTEAMRQKMARAMTTLITSGGMRELKQAKQMGKGFRLKQSHFEALAVPPEEDFARANLMEQFR